MILRALHELAEREQLVPDPDFTLTPVAWLVIVDPEGKLVTIRDNRITPPARGKAKPKPQAKPMRIPRQPGRTSGDRAFFLVDKAEYVLGSMVGREDGSRTADKLARRAGLFRDQISACVAATGDEGARAVLRALEEVAAGQQSTRLPEDCASNDLLAFVYSPDVDRLVHERPDVVAYWRAVRALDGDDSSTPRFQCLITGGMTGQPGNFPKVKRVPGAQTAGVPLVSFNAPAFESHGLSGNQNAPVSSLAAVSAATALERLVHPAFPDPRPEHRGETLPRRHLRLSEDTVVCYWSSEPASDRFLDVFQALIDRPDPAVVGDMYAGLWRGRSVQPDPGRFYALTLTGSQGRMIVRDWFETSVAEVETNLAAHFQDLDIVRNTPPSAGRELPPVLPLGVLLEALAPFGRRDAIPAPLASSLVTAALRGGPYPISLLSRAIDRMRAEVGRTEWPDLQRRDARAALIKAVLERRRRHSPATALYSEIIPVMDPTNRQPGYLLGRLLAVIERLQQTALGDVNASVVDRYFAAASATPRAVFTRLLRNARHHARKALDEPTSAGTARWLEGMIDEIAAPFDPSANGFPAHLDLEQQGLFMLGYHQQRHRLWMKRAERERTEAASAAPG
ncbi:MAG: type I-C CRISPR-associated protein Cas8c/Csd1 [Gemmatimonadaceae bacterium]